MSGMPISAFDSNVELVALVLEMVGGFCWLVGVPAMVAGRFVRWARSRLVDVAMWVSLAGIAVASVGAMVAGHWVVLVVTTVATVSLQLVREQRPNRPDRRRLQSFSASGVLALVGWWLAKDRQRYAAAVVKVERSTGRSQMYSLRQIRQEFVEQLLRDADRDEHLDRLLDGLVRQIEATVHGVGRINAEPGSPRFRMATYAKISDFANSVLAQATEPDAHRTMRPYQGYSATMLKLAAACRLAERELTAPAAR